MKKLITILLAAMLVCLVAVPAFAASAEMTVSASASTVHRGDTVTITVSISHVDQCTAVGMGVSFDTNTFEYVEGSYKLLVSNTSKDSFTYNANAGGYVASIMMSGAQSVSGNLFSFSLKVKDTAALNKTLTVTGTPSLRVNNAVTDCTAKGTSITVACNHSYDNACDDSCNICGESRTVSHSYDSGKVTTAATCTSEGVKTYTCSVCGATKTESVAKAEHSYDSGKITTEATCDGSGVMTYTCTVCGETKTDTVGSKGHSYDDGKITTEATCTAEGVKTYTCTNCGKTKTEKLDALGHVYDSDCDALCARCGAEREVTHKWRSSWSSDSSGHYHVCSSCGERKDEASHTPGAAATEWNDQKCTVCGYVLQEALGHTHSWADTFSYDDEGHWYVCSGCSVKEVQAHSFDNVCDDSCNICGYTREIMHNYAQRWSFDETGHWHECTDCGDKLELYAHVPGPEATEASDQICTECGYVLQAAANHEHAPIGDWLSNAQNHWQQCACGEHLNEAAHSWGEGVKGDEPGVTVFYCSECGYPMYCTDEVDPTTPEQPDDPAQTEPGPQETNPQGGGDSPKDDSQGFPWWILIVLGGVVVLGGIIFVIIGIVISKKQTGKYTGK